MVVASTSMQPGLWAAVITQLFSNMANIGVQYGYIYTGEAFICLHITEDPSVVQYYLLIPNLDVTDGDEFRQRTAVAHVLALTLNTMQASPPPQSWYDAAEQLVEWEINYPDPDYPDPLEHIPESVRKNLLPQYNSPSWKSIEELPSIPL